MCETDIQFLPVCSIMQTPEPPEQQPTSGGGGVAGGVVHSSSVGARLKNLAMGSSSGGVGVAGGGAAGAADRDKSKELREREKVEKRLTEVCRGEEKILAI